MPGFGKVKETRCNTDLRQLLRDPSEDMVVQVPGLCQILDVARQMVLAAPLLSLSKITAVRLKSTMHRQLSYQMSCCRLIFLPTDCTKEKNVKNCSNSPQRFSFGRHGSTHHKVTLEKQRQLNIAYLIELKVLHPTWHKTGHFGDILPCKSLGLVLKKLNPTQQKQTTQKQNSLS